MEFFLRLSSKVNNFKRFIVFKVNIFFGLILAVSKAFFIKVESWCPKSFIRMGLLISLVSFSLAPSLIGVFEFDQIVNIGVDLLFWRVAISSIIPMEELLINFLF